MSVHVSQPMLCGPPPGDDPHSPLCSLSLLDRDLPVPRGQVDALTGTLRLRHVVPEEADDEHDHGLDARRGWGGTRRLTAASAVLAGRRQASSSVHLALPMLGRNPAALARGLSITEGASNRGPGNCVSDVPPTGLQRIGQTREEYDTWLRSIRYSVLRDSIALSLSVSLINSRLLK